MTNTAISGTSGQDTLTGGVGDDSLFSFSGHGVFIGGAGNETINDGADRYAVYHGGALVGAVADLASFLSVVVLVAADEQDGTDTLISVEQVVGFAFADDSMVGRYGSANGDAGDAILQSGYGTELLHGGAGNDAFLGCEDLDVAGFQPGISRVDGLAVTGSGTNGWVVSAQGANFIEISLNTATSTLAVRDLRVESAVFGVDSMHGVEYIQLDEAMARGRGSVIFKLSTTTDPAVSVASVSTGGFVNPGLQGQSMMGSDFERAICGSDGTDIKQVSGTLATLTGNSEFGDDQHELGLGGYSGSDLFSQTFHANTLGRINEFGNSNCNAAQRLGWQSNNMEHSYGIST